MYVDEGAMGLVLTVYNSLRLPTSRLQMSDGTRSQIIFFQKIFAIFTKSVHLSQKLLKVLQSSKYSLLTRLACRDATWLRLSSPNEVCAGTLLRSRKKKLAQGQLFLRERWDSNLTDSVQVV